MKGHDMTSNKQQMTKAAFKAAKGNPLPFIDTAAAEYVAASGTMAKAVTRAVQATQVAKAAGIILAGRNNAHPDALTTEQFAAKFGVGKSNVTAWADMARFLDIGGNVDSALFGFLAGGHASNPVVRDAIRAGQATAAKVQSAWDSVYLPDGTKRDDSATKGKGKGGRKARPNDGTKVDVTKGKGLADAVESDPYVVALAAIRMLDSAAKRLDTESFAKVETKVQAIITREVTIRTKAAEQATKATRKPRASTTRGARKAAKRTTRKAA